MRTIRNVKPNVLRGGQAIPIGNNFYYMKGRKHEQGGIDVGKDLEVEGDEVIQITPKSLKVFSAQPILNGISPAKAILTGENPNKVFNAQERYKDRFNLKDDGTKKKARDGIKTDLDRALNPEIIEEAIPNTGYILTKASNVRNWGTATEIINSKGEKRTVDWILENQPDYEVYTDILGNAITGTAKDTREIVTDNTTPNANLNINFTPTSLIYDNPTGAIHDYTDRFGHRTMIPHHIGEKPIEPQNDLFYLAAPYLGLEDYIVGKGLQKGVRFIGNRVLSKYINNESSKLFNPNDVFNAIKNGKIVEDDKLFYDLDKIKYNIKNDRVVRINKALKEENTDLNGLFGKYEPGSEIDFYNGITFKDLPKDINGQHNSYTNKIELNSNINNYNPTKTLFHELGHKLRSKIAAFINADKYSDRFNTYINLKQKSNNPERFINDVNEFTSNEAKLLDDAYRFTDDYLAKYNTGNIEKDSSILAEKGEVNAELRQNIIDYYNLDSINIKEVDDAINNISNTELIDLLIDVNDRYSEDITNSILNEANDIGIDVDAPIDVILRDRVLDNPKLDYIFNNIKKALIGVGAAQPIISTIDDNNVLKYRFGGKIKAKDGTKVKYNLPEVVVTPRMNYTTYNGNETNIPTLNTFIDAKRNEARANAILKMQNTTLPTKPIIPNRFGRTIKRFTGPMYTDKELIALFGEDKNPSTCLSTVTNSYGRTISGNKTFNANPEKYGFIPTTIRDHGDIVQTIGRRGIPGHAALITGFEKDGNMLIDQSHGGLTEKDIKHDVNYYDERFPNKMLYYRFVGNDNDINNWKREYKTLYNKKRIGGKLTAVPFTGQ